MLPVFLVVLLAVLCTEALTEIVVKSLLFEPVREKVFPSARVLRCGHCFSLWASALVCSVSVFFAFPHIMHPHRLVKLFLMMLVVHRLSNYLHMFIDRFLDKFYRVSKL